MENCRIHSCTLLIQCPRKEREKCLHSGDTPPAPSVPWCPSILIQWWRWVTRLRAWHIICMHYRLFLSLKTIASDRIAKSRFQENAWFILICRLGIARKLKRILSKTAKSSPNFSKLKARREGLCFGESTASGISMWRGTRTCVRIVNLGGEIAKRGLFL